MLQFGMASTTKQHIPIVVTHMTFYQLQMLDGGMLGNALQQLGNRMATAAAAGSSTTRSYDVGHMDVFQTVVLSDALRQSPHVLWCQDAIADMKAL